MDDFFHKLKPIKKVDESMWLLRWRPILNGTYNFYWFKNRYCKKKEWSHRRFGFKYDFYKPGGQYGYDYDCKGLELHLYYISFYFWIKYNITCHESGAYNDPPLNFNIK